VYVISVLLYSTKLYSLEGSELTNTVGKYVQFDMLTDTLTHYTKYPALTFISCIDINRSAKHHN